MDFLLLRLLLLLATSVRATIAYGDDAPPLHRAAGRGHRRTVLSLLNSGKIEDVDELYGGHSTLWYAAEYGDAAIARALIDAGANVNFPQQADSGLTPLSWASRHGHSKFIGTLLEAGAEVDAAMTGDSIALRSSLGLTKRGATALFVAAEYGHADVVRQLANAGAKIETINDRGVTPLMSAARTALESERDQTKVVRALVDLGANVNAAESDGTTALIWAVSTGNAEMVRLLLELGADPRIAKCSLFGMLFCKSLCGALDGEDEFKEDVTLDNWVLPGYDSSPHLTKYVRKACRETKPKEL